MKKLYVARIIAILKNLDEKSCRKLYYAAQGIAGKSIDK